MDFTEDQRKALDVFCDIINFSWGAFTHREVLEQDGIYFADAIEAYRKSSTNKLSRESRKFLGTMIHSFRVALTGQDSGANFFLITGVLGRERVQKQIKEAMKALGIQCEPITETKK